MEVKINREIREYTENIYFGLSLRQFFFFGMYDSNDYNFIFYI